jgi:hypothetical protein
MDPSLPSKTLTLILTLATLTPLAAAARPAADQSPIPWGTINQNTSCVIFEQHRATRGMFWGVAATVTRYSVLQVVESHHYTLPKKDYKEDQATLDHLQDIAARDHVKFINIPGKVNTKKLKQARQMCQSAAAPQYDATSGPASSATPSGN